MSELSGCMTSALVDGFSGPMEIAITSCIGLPRTWNFTAGLAETCGICFCGYYRPHNLEWFEVWAANVLRDALVGKSNKTRFAFAVVYDGGKVGNYMQRMELPLTYLYDLPVFLLESSKLRDVFIETGLMQREVEFVTGSGDNTEQVWTLRGEKKGMLRVGSTVSCVDITHDWIFTGVGSGMVHKFSRSDHLEKASANTHKAEVISLTVACGFVFTTSKDRTIKISGIQTLELISKYQDSRGLGRVICITVGIEFYFAGGLEGAQRLSFAEGLEGTQGLIREATPIKLRSRQERGAVLRERCLHVRRGCIERQSCLQSQ